MIAAAKTARASSRNALWRPRPQASSNSLLLRKRCLHATGTIPKSAAMASAGVVQATNMPLSNLYNFVASAQPQQQHQEEQQYYNNNDNQQGVTQNQRQALAAKRDTATAPSPTPIHSATESPNANKFMASALRTSPARPTGTTSSLMDSFAAESASKEDRKSSSSSREMEQRHSGIDIAELKRLASLTPTPLRLGDMYRFAASHGASEAGRQQRLRNAQFLHRELPIRLAQRAYDLLSLPHGLSAELESAAIRQVAQKYWHDIRQLQAFPVPETFEEENRFTELLHGMILDRTTTPTSIAKGLLEWSSALDRLSTDITATGDENNTKRLDERRKEIEDALQRFFTARVGLRFLTEHHILSAPVNHPTFYNYVKDSDVAQQIQPLVNGSKGGTQTNSQASQATSSKGEDRGCIQHDCNAVEECRKVAEEVTRQTYDCYGMCPEIEIVDRQSASAQVFTYVPHHLHYMLAELLKNSCRASVERYMKEGGDKSLIAKIPPVRVVLVKGKNEMTIKVSDQGGGIPRSTMARIFKFTHSTAQQEKEKGTDFGTVEAGIQHMRGFGLPLARIYARYFGGELTLKSMEGYGLDAYLYLPRLGDACENLPARVVTSPGEQVSLPSVNTKKKNVGHNNTLSTARNFSTMIPKEIREATAELLQRRQETFDCEGV